MAAIAWSPLHLAALSGDYDQCKKLVEEGAEIDMPSTYGQTALHFAASASSIPMCTLLVDAGWSPHILDKLGRTPLHCAARAGAADVCKYLLSKGASPLVRDKNGRPPMALGCWNLGCPADKCKSTHDVLLEVGAPTTYENCFPSLKELACHAILKDPSFHAAMTAMTAGAGAGAGATAGATAAKATVPANAAGASTSSNS